MITSPVIMKQYYWSNMAGLALRWTRV